MVKNIKGGSYIAGFDVLAASLVYDGKTYNSEKTDNGGNGKGWIIAVAVASGVVGLILTIILIVCIVKKIKAGKDDYDSDQHAEESAKGTSKNLKKQKSDSNESDFLTFDLRQVDLNNLKLRKPKF